MNKEQLQSFLLKCIIINTVFLALLFFVLAGAREFIINIWIVFIPISPEKATTFIFYFFGFWKLIIWVFMVFPYIALRLMKK